MFRQFLRNHRFILLFSQRHSENEMALDKMLFHVVS